MRISLVCPPFATVRLPSLGLTQLKARLRALFGDRVSVQILYLNHDLAPLLGLDVYEEIANSIDIYHTGFGDWFFRHLAFPDEEENREAYLKRHFRKATPERAIVERAIARRDQVGPFLDGWIAERGLLDSDLVGTTTMFAQTVAGIALARRVKAGRPSVLTALGGAGCEGVMGRELARRVPVLDYVFSGGALVSLPELVGGLLEGRAPRVRGVFTQSEPRRLATVEEGCDAELGAELPIDEPLELDYDDYLASFQAKIDSKKPALLFETSRGCWWGEIKHCTFCGLNGETMASREMSPDRALAQLESLFRRYPGVTWFQAVDNIMPHRYLKTVLPRLSPPPGATIYYEIKSNLDDDEVRLLAERQVNAVQPGIEALSTPLLELMAKGVSAFQNLRFLASCQMHGVAPNWNFLIGFPGEPAEAYAKYVEDLPLFYHLAPPNGIGPVRFDRYSPYHTRAAQYGLDLHPFDYYRFVYPFDDAALANIAYHFVQRDPRFYVPIARWLKRLKELVDTWQARWCGTGGNVPARLHFRGGDGLTVYDSRSGRAVDHLLSANERATLDWFGKPRTVESLAGSEVGRRAGFDAAREVARLRELGLLFEEGGRYLGLVLPGEPAAMEWDRDELWSHGNLPSYLFARPSSSSIAATVSIDSK